MNCPNCGKKMLPEVGCPECNIEININDNQDEVDTEALQKNVPVRTTSFTFNGIGTSYFGESEYQCDGSYIKTEFICFLYIPLIPLRSMRVYRDASGDGSLLIFTRTGYAVKERIPLYWKQVFYIYVLLLLTYYLIIFVMNIYPVKYKNNFDVFLSRFISKSGYIDLINLFIFLSPIIPYIVYQSIKIIRRKLASKYPIIEECP